MRANLPPSDLSYFDAFKWIYARIPRKRRKQFWFLFFAMTFTALIESAALGSLALFASTVADPEGVLNSRHLINIKQYIPFITFSTASIIVITGFTMIILIAVKNIIKGLVNYSTTLFGFQLSAYFGSILLNGFLTLPYRWHLTRNSADLVNAVAWRSYLGYGVFNPCLTILNSILMALVMLFSLFIVQPVVSSFVILVIGSVAIFIYTVIKRKIDKFATTARNYKIAINKDCTMAIHGIKDVKIAMKEKSFASKFLNKALPLSKISGAQAFYNQAPMLIMETVGLGMLFLSICFMLLWTNKSTAYTTGTMALMAVAAWRVLPSVSIVLTGLTTLRRSLPYIKYQMDYLKIIDADQKTSNQTKGSSVKEDQILAPMKFKIQIRFESVSFSYQDTDKQALKNISFEIKKGETIGIVGTSGAGKSTLVDILIGLLKPDTGKVTIDENELTQERLGAWLMITGYVPQSPYIYDRSLAENVAFGIDSAAIDRERVKKCCAMASMEDFLNELPDGIDSSIGERGAKLSGGQQQRVAIARALYNQPEVMVFDEATSSLDTNSEKKIQETIYSFKGQQTLVIIAHRLSTVRNCDKVIWLEKGRINMIDTPDNVINVYANGEKVS